jgi:type II secretory pathway component PulF
VRRRRAGDLAAFARDLSTLLGAGIPLLTALETTARQQRRDFRRSLALLRDRVAAGVSLAEAMAQQPDVFDELAVHMVEVGEHSGSLEPVLARLADFQEKSLRFKNKVLNALAYPCFVLAMAGAVTVGLMTFVIPKLLESLIESGHPLPWPTRVVKAMSDFLVGQWWVLLLGAGAVLALLGIAKRSEPVRRWWDRVQLRIPFFGQLIQKQSIARVALFLVTMLRSGVVFVRALQVAQRATPNRHIREALGRCESAVRNGREISDSLNETGAFPPVVVQIFSVGQQSGRLEEMLDRLATDYEQQVAMASERLTALIEPVLVLLLVGVVGLIAFATILPLMEAADVF